MKHNGKTDFFERHASKIVILSECGCWIWTGASTIFGYGIVFDGRISPAGNHVPDGAHRVAYREKFGEIPNGKYVLHKCDVPSCVNPDHLFLGTQADNMKDKVAKGRSPRGENHPRATVSNESVIKMRNEYARGGITIAELAEKYGIKRSTAQAIISGQSFKYLNQAGVAP